MKIAILTVHKWEDCDYNCSHDDIIAKSITDWKDISQNEYDFLQTWMDEQNKLRSQSGGIDRLVMLIQKELTDEFVANTIQNCLDQAKKRAEELKIKKERALKNKKNKEARAKAKEKEEILRKAKELGLL